MATAAPALSDDALAEMLSLMKGAGSVELKLLSTKCAPDEDAQGARVLLQAVAPHLTNMCRWNAFGQPVAVDAGARRHDPAACARSRRYSGCVAQ
ncbi:MAG TPA: hypothetical protein VFY32_11520 [Solirubrobacteraceae bacterium]|nr:hypothetical protein [Solirubrobacteraceae bacterium]